MIDPIVCRTTPRSSPTVVAGLTLAFIGGVVASKLKLPPLVGYVLAGVAVGPFTPGFVADEPLALQLAEIGIILLMFGRSLSGINLSFRHAGASPRQSPS